MAQYFGSSSDSGQYVDAGASGRVQYADNRYAEAYVVRDGKGDSEMYAHVFDGAGHILRTIEVREDSDYNYDPSVAALQNGKFVVAWTNSDDDDAATDTHVLARVYSNDGSNASTILQVSGNGKQHADEASVVGLTDKKFVIAYENDTTHTVHVATFTEGATGRWTETDKVIDSSVGSNGGNPLVERVDANHYVVHYTDADGHQANYNGTFSGGAISSTGGGSSGGGSSGGLGGLFGSIGDHAGGLFHFF